MSGESWKLSLPCTRAEAEALTRELPEVEALDPPPVLLTSEPDPDRPDEWRLDAYFEAEPDDATLALVRRLVPSAAHLPAAAERVEQQDWVTLSQQGLEPIRAGRFFVHTPAHRHSIPADAMALEIDAGRAFGTGQHETTTGCLLALTRLAETGISPRNVADIGTGTGLLAFAALRLWPAAQAIASDIDPVSIEVAAENAAINDLTLGTAAGQLELAVAPGLDHPRLAGRAPYDLLIANILAAPLIELAPALSAALAPGGRLLLAGLLRSQAETVLTAYRRHGLTLAFTIERGDWPTLTMRKRRATGWR
jgi:ribosomal protein L11 methyltransferase